MSVLKTNNVAINFGGVQALRDGNLSCELGKITGLLGANGSGKSTLSKVICGVYCADKGTIEYEGKAVRYKNPHEAVQNGISMVFQNLSLVPDLTVWQNIVLGRETRRGLFLDNKRAREDSAAIVERLMPGLDIDRKVSALGTSELQVTEIAKALYKRPRFLILDEPTAALEQTEVRRLFEVMRELAADGVSMIFTSHRMWEVMEICDSVTVFRNGETVGYFDFEKDGKYEQQIVDLIAGDKKMAVVERARRNLEGAPIMLEAENIELGSKLRGVSLSVRKGEIVGIGGLAGQGQHELLLALAGNYSMLRAKINVDGKQVTLNRPRKSIREKIMLVPGDRHREGLFLGHSIYRNMIFPKLAKRDRFILPTRRYRAEAAENISKLSLNTADLDVIVGTLSGGNQQKVVVGKWLSFDKKVLLLSDPAKGVDVGAKHDLYELIEKLVAEQQISVILYASDASELVTYCDRILVMYEGRIVEQLEGDRMTEQHVISASMQIGGAVS